jgi:transcription-repair coupling factor (superfamily II helicase)
VRTDSEVPDIASEWIDRYGPLPVPVEALLSVARLRATALRIGLRELSVVKTAPGSAGPARMGEALARISPIGLKVSEEVRLHRLAPRAIYKSDLGQLLVPFPASASIAAEIWAFLEALVPDDAVLSA